VKFTKQCLDWKVFDLLIFRRLFKNFNIFYFDYLQPSGWCQQIAQKLGFSLQLSVAKAKIR
jgi:hypothetical protein